MTAKVLRLEFMNFKAIESLEPFAEVEELYLQYVSTKHTSPPQVCT